MFGKTEKLRYHKDMGLYLKQQETRTPLQEKLAKELQEKAKQRAVDEERPDGVDDSRYIEGTKTTTSLAWVWVLIALATIALVVWLVVSTAR